MVLARCAALKRLFPLLASLALCALPVRAQVTVSQGTLGAATGTSAATAAPPAGTAANDVAIVYCWARNTGDTTAVSGYTEIPGTHVNTSTGSHRWFWRRLSGAATTATCNHNTSSDNYARMFVFRGLVKNGNPWDAVNAGVSGAPDSSGEYTVSGITAGTQSMVVVFSGYEDNDESNIACTGTAPAAYTASYAESSTGSGGSINACYAIKSSAGATGGILVNYGNLAGSHDAGTLAISLTHACSGPTIGAHTVCGGATAYENPSPAAFVSATYTPAVGNGVLLQLSWGGGSDPLNESITSIVNQDGISLDCFVASPGSTSRLYSGPGTDEEAWAFYYCPAIPSSPSITAIRANLSASTPFIQENVVEFSAGTIQTTDFWDNENTAVSSLEGQEASVSLTNTHANDLLIAYLHNGLPTYPNGGYPPVTADSNYTAIVGNPAYHANEMLEAKAVSSTGSQTATITWNTPLQWFAGMVGLKAVDSGSASTFTFDLSTLPAQTFGNAPFSVASYVTTNSTGTATFALGAGSVGCTVTSAGLVTITGAAVGTNFCVIAASLPANGNYSAAGPISQSFQIARGTPAFSFSLSSLPAQTFGNAPFSVAGYATTNSTGKLTFGLGTGSAGCTVTSGGVVTLTGPAVGTNYCVITASLAASANYLAAGPISQSFHIASATLTLRSISVTPTNRSIAKGTTQQFTATGTYSNSSRRNITSSVTWSSSSASVATVASTGLASGVGAGSAIIRASLSGVSGSTSLTVRRSRLGSSGR